MIDEPIWGPEFHFWQPDPVCITNAMVNLKRQLNIEIGGDIASIWKSWQTGGHCNFFPETAGAPEQAVLCLES